MNRGVIWLLVIAVVVVGLLLFFRNRDDKGIENKAEDLREDTKDLGKDLGNMEKDRLSDGNFTGQSDVDSQGNYGSLNLVIDDGKITKASYVEYQKEGNQDAKDETYPYPLALDAMRELEKDLLKEQNPEDVDSIAGATATSEKFKTASKRALEKAK